MASNSEHSVIIRIIDQASKAIKGIEKNINGMLRKIEKHKEGIQAIGVASGVAFAGLTAGIMKAVGESNRLENALIGLESIVVGTGGNFEDAKQKVIEFTQDGLVGVNEASLALKNLLARGYNQDEALAVMSRIKDAAAYGRQAGLSLGEAVVTATEGLKNENSILVDNAGITKNVAKMWDDYAKQLGKSTRDLTDAEKRQAEINGIMEETKFQIGDAEKVSKTFSGTLLRVQGGISTLFSEIGATIKPVLNDLLVTIEPIITKITEWIKNNEELAEKILLVSTVVAGLIAGLAGFALVLGPIVSGFKLFGAIIGGIAPSFTTIIAVIKAVGVAIGFLASPIGIIIALIAGFAAIVFFNWDLIKKITIETFENIKNFLFGTFENIKNIGGEFIYNLVEQFSILWENIKNIFNIGLEAILIIVNFGLDSISGVFNFFSLIFSGNWGKLWEGIKSIVSVVFGFIKNIIITVLSGINEWIRNIFGVDLAGVFSDVWEGAKNIAIGAIEALDGFVRPILDGLVGFVEKLIGGIKKAWDTAKSVKDWVGSRGNEFVNTFSIQGVYRAVSGTGARASGGPVSAGSRYMVGERGPELFVPNTSGYIIPNNQLGGATININMGGVVVTNEADENRLVEKIKSTMYREMRFAKLGF